MNRENKRKQYQKGYYKTHACDDSFTCRVCGRPVVLAGAGIDHRNHCPNCLSSLHVDDEPGDRAADCGGIMDAIGVWVRIFLPMIGMMGIDWAYGFDKIMGSSQYGGSQFHFILGQEF